uniref:Prefoldin subunit 5 n=1 Tax=Acrobeloides nanus TaxID=290746 RepID=A0A914D932_9BILA
MADAEPRRVEINSLSIQQLSALQKQFEAEISFFQQSLNELKQFSSKFGACENAVSLINPQEKNKPALVPLSESVYIKAKIPDPDKYLVDIGTGYYAEMTIEQAKLYFRRKSAYVEQQVETIQHKLLPEKQKVRQIIVETLQKKIQEMSLSIQPQSSENATS